MELGNDFNFQVQQNSLKNAELDIDVKDLYNKSKTASTNIQNLQNSVNTISGQVTTLNTDVSSLNSSVSTINGSISTITGNINTINGNISTMNGSINTLSGDITSIDGAISTINGSINSLNSQILSLEKVTVVYDKTSNDPALNLGYTAGITGSANVSIDLSAYEYIRMYVNVYSYSTSNIGATSAMILMSLHNSFSNLCITNARFGYCIETGLHTKGFTFFARYNKSTKVFTPEFYYETNMQTSGSYYVYKIEGVK